MTYRGIVISDASCLIALERINALYLFGELFETVTVTHEVVEEFKRPLPECFEIRESPEEMTKSLQATGLDIGEASAIALASVLENCLLLIDEEKGRKEALRRGIHITGTLGLLLRAKKNEVIDRVLPLVEQLKHNGFRVSDKLIRETLDKAGEI